MALDLYLHAVWGELTYQQVDGNWTQIQSQFNALQVSFAQSIPQNNLTATTAPTINDDAGDGYSELSRWYDTVTETLYICIDPSAGAAVWIEDDFDPLGFGSAALAQLGTGPSDVPQNSDLGTAAYKNIDVATSTADATASRVMLNGAGGWMGDALSTVADCDSPTLGANVTALYQTVGGVTTNQPTASNGVLLHIARGSRPTQIWYSYITMRQFTRYYTVSGWTPWRMVYDQGSVVGTVSQSSGVPTGGVVEYISNANGKAIRFADGTQMAWNDNAAITIDPAAFTGTPASIDGAKFKIGRWY